METESVVVDKNTDQDEVNRKRKVDSSVSSVSEASLVEPDDGVSKPQEQEQDINKKNKTKEEEKKDKRCK